MPRRIGFVAMLFLVCAGAGACAQDVFTLEDAVRLATEKSTAVRTATSQYEQARMRTRQALGLLGFRFESSATYERYIPATSFGQGASQDDSKALNFTASYPIDVVGLGRRASKAAWMNEQAAFLGIEVELNKLQKTVREAYYGVLRAKEGVAVRQSALNATTATLENLRKRFAEGDIPKFDVIRLETEVARAEAALIEARNNLVLAKQVLNFTVNRPVDTDFEVRQIEGTPSLPSDDLDLLAISETRRPEISQLKNLLQARKFVTITETAGLSPSLNIGANHRVTIDPGAFQNGSQTTLQLSLRWPLFDSGITKARVKAAREDENQVILALEQTRLGISLEIKSALARLKNASEQLMVAEKTVNLQKESLRLAEVRYENQVGILLDVTVAQSDLTLAEFGVVNARYEYLTAYAALQQAVGADQFVSDKN